jgi:hypothetical protein
VELVASRDIWKGMTRQGGHTPAPRERKKERKARSDGPVGGVLAHLAEEGGSGEWAERVISAQANTCVFFLLIFCFHFSFFSFQIQFKLKTLISIFKFRNLNIIQI